MRDVDAPMLFGPRPTNPNDPGGKGPGKPPPRRWGLFAQVRLAVASALALFAIGQAVWRALAP